MKKEKELSIGKCPVCGEGEIIPTEFGYQCDAKKQQNGSKCKFTIHKVQHGVVLDDELVRELITEGRTRELQMVNKIDQPFNASFVIKDGKVCIDLKAHYMRGKCPVCGGRVLKTSRGYACENNLLNDQKCNFKMSGVICGRSIQDEEMESFLSGTPEIMDGFTSQQGKAFSSSLVVKEDGTVGLDSSVTKCPVCGGNILVSPVAYNCSNYGNPDVQCKFSVWRNICGHSISKEEMRQICEEGATRQPLELYKANGRVYYKRLGLSPDKQKIIKF